MGIIKNLLISVFILFSFISFAQIDEYYRKIDWKFYPSNVEYINDSTYRMQAIPYDYNDPGAVTRIVGKYVVDYSGRRYQVIDSTSTTITVVDIYHTGYAPQTDQIARCYKSVGNGEADFIGSVDYSPLDESARWKLNGSDNELLWRIKPKSITFKNDSIELALWSGDTIKSLFPSSLNDSLFYLQLGDSVALINHLDTLNIYITGDNSTIIGTGTEDDPFRVNTEIIATIDSVKQIVNDSVRATEWNAAYNDKINSLAFTGTTTKTLTLNQQDGGTVTGTFTDDNSGGTVTSVAKGNGMNFTTFTTTGTITLGTPSTLTSSTTNSVTASSHTHAITTFDPTVSYNSSTSPISVSGGKVLGSALTINADTISTKGLATQYDLTSGLAAATNQNYYIKNQTATYQPASFKIRGIGELDSTYNTSSALTRYTLKVNATETNGHNSANLVATQSVANHSGSVKNNVVVGLDGRVNLSNNASSVGAYASSGIATLTGSSKITGSAASFYGYITNSSSSLVPWVIGSQNYVLLNGTNETTNVRGVYTDVYNNSSSLVDNVTGYNSHFQNNNGGTINLVEGFFTQIRNNNGTINKAHGGVFDISTYGTARTKEATGVLIGEWTTTGIVDTSYALRIDSTVDAGNIRYAIYSESKSDSKLDGDLILSKLSGINTRLVTADNNGKLSTTLNNTTRWNQHITNDLDTVIGNEYQNITYQRYSDKGILNISSGTGDTIPVVDSVNAGLMTPEDKAKLDTITSHQPVTIAEASADLASIDGNQVLTINRQDLLPVAPEYGYIYNWWVTQEDVAPDGWHVPTIAEWDTLFEYLGDEDGDNNSWPLVGGMLKEIGTTYWDVPNEGAINSTGFNALGSGTRYVDGEFVWFKESTNYLSSTEYISNINYGCRAYLFNSNDESAIDTEEKSIGSSLRFIKDDSTDPGTVTDYDGNEYATVKIGDQVWMAANFRGVHYNDGTPIAGPDFTNEEWAALTTPAYCIYKQSFDEKLADIDHNSTKNKDGGDPIDNYFGHVTEAQNEMIDTISNYLEIIDSTLISHDERLTNLETIPIIDTLFYNQVINDIIPIQLGDTLQSLAIEQPDSIGQIPTWNQDSGFFETIHNINDLEPVITAGTTSQYWRGDKTWQDFNTTSRNSISLTTTGNSGASTYTPSTGVFNIPNYTLAGLGGVAKVGTSTDNAIVRFDGTSGNQQNSGVTIDDNNNVSAGGVFRSASASSSSRYGDLAGNNNTYLTNNLSFDGTNWNLDNTGQQGFVLFSGPSTFFQIRYASLGTNPRALTEVLGLTNAGALTVPSTIQATTTKNTNLTPTYLPLHEADNTGFIDANVFQTSNKLRYNTTVTVFDNDNDIPNVGWVNSIATGNTPKLPVDAATTANITLSGTQTIDGFAVTAGMRVLVKDQSTTSQNGVYVVAAGAWSRATDLDTWAELYKAYVAVLNGTVSGGASYVCTIASTGTLGTDPITWVLYNTPANILVNSPLSKTGNTISLNYDTNTLDISAGNLKVKDNVFQALLNGNGFIKVSGTTVSYDNSTYLTTEADPMFAADSANLLHWSDTLNLTKGIATPYDLTNFYTKTNLQTSGQSSVHWGNITNKPISTNTNLGNSNDSIPTINAVQVYVNNAVNSIQTENKTTQTLTGTNVSWNVNNGINAKITLTGATTITMSNLTDGMEGSLYVINGGDSTYRITFAGYTVEIYPSVWYSGDTVGVSGGTIHDIYSYKYVGGVLVINGALGLK